MKRGPLGAAVLVAAVLVSGLTVVGASGTSKTFYFHAENTVSDVEEAQAFAGAGSDPTMDENAPTSSDDKVAVATGVLGNNGFRKNLFGAYWVGEFSGLVAGDPTVVFWAQSAASQTLEVRLFANGPAGVTAPLGTQTAAVQAGIAEYTVTFAGLEAAVERGLVAQIFARTVNNALGDAQIFFDSVQHPSRVSFTLAPFEIPLPKLDDPFGIAFRGADLLAANAGTGHVLSLDPVTFASFASVHGGIVPGGFARGVTGLAVDGNGTVYAAVAETGEVLTVPSSGGPGAYARGLGTPIGIAFAPDKSLYIADRVGKRIVKVELVTTTTKGKKGTTTTTRKLTLVAAGFAEGPYGLAFAPDGTLAVSTQIDGKVFSIDLATSTVTQIASLNDNDPATALTDSAEGLAFDTAGNLYIGDGRAGKLKKRDPAGTITDAATGLGGPLNLAFRPGTGTLLVATQGEGRAAGDAILEVAAGDTGIALAAPTGLPGALPPIARAWVHRSVGAADATKPLAAAARPIDPAAFTGALPQAEARYTGELAIEPTLGIQNDGDQYIVESKNPCSITLVLICGRSEVFRSDDDGLSWDEITPDTDQGQEMPPISTDPYIIVDRDTDRIFNFDLTSACHYLSYSDDDGKTWTQNELACAYPPVDHQTIVTADPRTVTTDGYPNVVHTCGNWPGAATPCQRSLDGGDSWEATGIAYATVPPLLVSRCGAGIASHLAADADGRIFLPRVSSQSPCISISEDDGERWTVWPVSTTVPGGSDHEGRVAADPDGNLYYVWISRDRLPWLAISRNHGKTWGAPKMIAPPGVTETNLPSIVAGVAGHVAISYMGTTMDYGYSARNYGKASWNAYITTTTEALAADPVYTTTTANPLTDPIKRNGCGPGRCHLIFDFLDVQIDNGGRVWATFGDMCYDTCVTDRAFDTSFAFAEGFVAPLAIGPSMNGGTLAPLGGSTAASFLAGDIGAAIIIKGKEVQVYGTGALAPGAPKDIEIGFEELGFEYVDERCEETPGCPLEEGA